MLLSRTDFCAFLLHRTDTTVIGCSGFHGDCLTLTKIIDARLKVGWSRKFLGVNLSFVSCLK